jgi:hypothetical protein
MSVLQLFVYFATTPISILWVRYFLRVGCRVYFLLLWEGTVGGRLGVWGSLFG